MEAITAAITGFISAIGAPFLIQLLKRANWKGAKAKWFAFGVSAIIATAWVLLTGLAGHPDTTGALEFAAWLLGAITVMFTVATSIYKWLEEKVFNKIPNIANLVSTER